MGAAKEAFPAWSVTPSEERIDLVEQLLEAYKDRAQDFGEAMSIEMGAPIDFAKTKQFERGIINMKKGGANVHVYSRRWCACGGRRASYPCLRRPTVSCAS